MMATLRDLLFGCWHRNYSFPITRPARNGRGWKVFETYVVCLDCGAEFDYCWRTMRLGKRIERPIEQRDFVTEARRVDDEQRTAGPTRQEPLQKTVLTIERKKA